MHIYNFITNEVHPHEEWHKPQIGEDDNANKNDIRTLRTVASIPQGEIKRIRVWKKSSLYCARRSSVLSSREKGGEVGKWNKIIHKNISTYLKVTFGNWILTRKEMLYPHLWLLDKWQSTYVQYNGYDIHITPLIQWIYTIIRIYCYCT